MALNGLVSEGVISAFKTDVGRKDSVAGLAVVIEVTIAHGADGAEVVSRVRKALPEKLADATVRTRAA